MNILFTVCGRAGSKGLKNKNLKKMNGVPLCYYTLAAIRLYQKKHPEHEVHVALNTDSPDMEKQFLRQSIPGRSHVVKRKESLAGDRVAKVDVIQDTYRAVKAEGIPVDIVVDLDNTSPMRRVTDIEQAIAVSTNGEHYDVVYSVVPSRRSPYFNMVEQKADGSIQQVCASNFTARQQAPAVYEMNASIYAYSTKFLDGAIEKGLLEYHDNIIIMPDYLVLDIDSEEDFIMMQEMMNLFSKQDEGLREVLEEAQGYSC